MPGVAVLGGGVAGLTVAWELARAGIEVDLYEAGEQLGGAVSAATLSGLRIDAGAEAFATRTEAVGELIAELGLTDQIVSPNPAGAWLQLPTTAAPLPATGILGIPGDPSAADVTALLGARAAARAAEDLTATMNWSADQAPSLGEVVADRMGEAVVEKLVAPITSGVHSADPWDLGIGIAHPRLYETMLTQGSLARAVTSLKAAAPAGSAVQSLHGGMHTLVDALEQQLRRLGGRIHLNTPVMDSAALAHTMSKDAAPDTVLAVDGPQAQALAAGLVDVPALPADQGRGVALVTLLVHAAGLDEHPRGTGMLVAPSVEHIRAKAMTHISAKWEWASQTLHQRLGPGHHLLRLSYGRVTDDPAPDTLGYVSLDKHLVQAAIEDLPRLTGVDIGPGQVLDSTVVRWQRALPGTSAEHRLRAQQFRQALADQRAAGGTNLWATGAWFAGTGLAQVIPDARSTAREIAASS